MTTATQTRKPRKRTRAKPKAPTIAAKWRKLFALMPGYDPIATAEPGQWFDPEAAQRAIDFFHEMLTHVKGELAGKPLILEPWQQAEIACIFGWKRRDGTRRYREVFDYEPRKNGKTTKSAGIVLYLLVCDDEPGAEIYSGAAEREQAALVYQQAKGMIAAEPELASRLQPYYTFKSIEYKATNSFYKAISADANTKHGFNAHGVVIDELHAQPNRELVDVLITSTGSRRQPLVVHITTADYLRESICNEKYEYACKVRDGIIADSSFLPIIYEASREDDWTDEATWEKANPNLDVSVCRDYLRRECKRAQDSPAYENTFKRLHLNVRTEQDVRWLQMAKWDACNGAVDEKALEGRECFAGLDLASTTDIAALALLFPPKDEGEPYKVLPYFWVPGDNIDAKSHQDKVAYGGWINRGHLEATPGNVIDYDVIRRRIGELGKRFNIREVAIDRWNSTQLQTQLDDDGFTVVQFGQGFASMSAPTKDLEGLVLSRRLAHAGQPVLRWMASNVMVEIDAAGNLKPSKKRATEKIDGIVALIMALGRALVQPAQKASVYEHRGFIEL